MQLKNIALGIVIGVLLTVGFGYFFLQRSKFTTPYQAILLDDNQVYYGKIFTPLGHYLILTDVFYIKSGVDPQTKETKSVLVKRGKELHGPDRMYLNKKHIVLIEPVGTSSQVAKLIEQSKNE